MRLPSQHLCKTQIWSDFAETCTRGSILADKDSVWRTFTKSWIFLRTEWTQSLHFWSNFEASLPLEDGQNKKNKYFSENFNHLAIQICQNQGHVFPSLSGKNAISFAICGLYLVGNKTVPYFQGSEGKSDLAYFTNASLNQFNIKKFSFHFLPVLWL